MTEPVVKVEPVERDAPCRAWRFTLDITKGDEVGRYIFNLSDIAWRNARDNGGWGDGCQSPQLFVEREGAQ